MGEGYTYPTHKPTHHLERLAKLVKDLLTTWLTRRLNGSDFHSASSDEDKDKDKDEHGSLIHFSNTPCTSYPPYPGQGCTTREGGVKETLAVPAGGGG